MKESQLVHDVLRAWGSHPRLRLARINTGGAKLKGRFVRFNPPGTADIVGLIAPTGRMVMIECKSNAGKQRDAQRVMERVVNEFGGLYVLAYQLADVDLALGALGLFRA